MERLPAVLMCVILPLTASKLERVFQQNRP
jgi:hypothetical protein